MAPLPAAAAITLIAAAYLLPLLRDATSRADDRLIEIQPLRLRHAAYALLMMSYADIIRH